MSTNETLVQIALESGTYEALPTKKFTQRKLFAKPGAGVIQALIPGTIEQIGVTVGQSVTQGETLMILEAMKMLNRIKAPISGTIKAIPVAVGEKVTKGQLLLEIHG